MKKKIFINARFLTQPISGVQRVSHELLRAFDALIELNSEAFSSFEFEMIAPRKGHLHTLDLRHIPLRKAGRFSGHLWEQFELPRLTRGGLLFCPGNTAPLASLRSGDSVVVTVHDLSYLYFPDAYSAAFRAVYGVLIPRILSKADAVITVSNSEKRAISERYPSAEQNVTPIQNGGLAARWIAEIDEMETDRNSGSVPLLIYVGALNRRKNLQGILTAFGIVAAKREARLLLVGGGGRSFDNNRFDIPEGLAGRIEFAGQIDDTRRLIEIYRSADCLLFPSFYEASPLPPLEAMACGCPVVAGDIPSLRERCGKSALFCDPNRPDEIAARVESILDDAALRERLRSGGRSHAADFTWERCALSTLDVLDRAFAGRRS